VGVQGSSAHALPASSCPYSNAQAGSSLLNNWPMGAAHHDPTPAACMCNTASTATWSSTGEGLCSALLSKWCGCASSATHVQTGPQRGSVCTPPPAGSAPDAHVSVARKRCLLRPAAAGVPGGWTSQQVQAVFLGVWQLAGLNPASSQRMLRWWKIQHRSQAPQNPCTPDPDTTLHTHHLSSAAR
jgi:hypothetical protein